MKERILNNIVQLIEESVWSKSLIKIRATGPLDKAMLYQDITIKLVDLKAGSVLQFLYKYTDKVITKNYKLEEAKDIILSTIPKFKNFTLVSSDHTYQYNSGRDKLYKSVNKQKLEADTKHNKNKNYLIDQDRPYLKLLGLTNSSGNIKANRGAKFKQINRYVEIMAGLVKEANLGKKFSVVDMGSGKGYLTFALFDFLNNKEGLVAEITGVELRNELVEKCNRIAKSISYSKLSFCESTIQSYSSDSIDVLIALHACDTATDDAIANGINSDAKLIVCSPCCHKQIRKQMNTQIKLEAITKFGILLERQAEIITDVLRTLILELKGYKTKVLEFISTEHTSKNLLIVAIKNSESSSTTKTLEQIKLIKEEFGIDYHYLEKALGLNI